jgi:hypothetical protein
MRLGDPQGGARRSNRGASLLETLIALSLFPLLIGACLTTIDSTDAEAERGGRMADLVRRADRALSTLTDELERSGFTSIDGVDYPFFVDGAELDDAAEKHQHAEANAAAGAAVTAREVVFVLPQDANADGWPDLTDTMQSVSWDATQVSYVLLPSPDGSNQLVRREDGANDRVLARGVRRFLVEDAASAGFVFPINVLRVTLELEDSGEGDARQTLTATRHVTLPNGTPDGNE